MKKLAILPSCLGCIFAVTTTHAIDLKQSKVTQVVNDVQIISAANQQEKNASVNDIFSMPDILRTGPASRAELVAADETVTRVGANTIFSFDPATRTIDLQQGSLLFHSPHGKGGGTIHTGSATASVLGTTLIVTTTPTGGMKVLDLEGSVEVNFLNGLKQNLAPGHMTFVMPGGSQLTPIIVFRLDAVAQQSLLVNGFNQNLASMPLIQQQIDKQLKLIQSGKYTDNDQLAPNDPGSPPLDLNTLQAALNRPVSAFDYDVTINGSSLPPNHIFLDSQLLLPDNTYYTGQPFEGLAARNIFFNTIGANPLPIDMSLYPPEPKFGSEFDFVAANNLTLAGSVDFDGLSACDIFSLVAGNQLIVAAGATISANVANFNWQTPHDITLDGVRIQNNAGNTSFGLGGNFTMENNAYINTAANVSVRAAGNITMNHSAVVADSMFLTSVQGTVNLDSDQLNLNSFGILTANQDLTVNNTVFNANSDSGLAGFHSQNGTVSVTGQSITAGSASFTAPGLITLNNVGLSNVGYMNAVANTITVAGSTFNANNAYNFGVKNGAANINNGVVMGDANFINDNIGVTALTQMSQVDQTTAAKLTAGIHVYTK